MKVYWSARDTEDSPPPDANFHFRPFFPDGSAPFQKEPAVRVEELPPPTKVRVLSRKFLPDKQQWKNLVQTALSKRLDKVVLARCQVLELEEAPDPFALAAALKERAQGSYVFCFCQKDTAFLGASPERLFSRRKNHLLSEAVAGTRRRAKTKKEDERLGLELLCSAKDLREFSPVVQFLNRGLSPLCSGSLRFSPISLHKTQNVQHLYASCKGRLEKETSDEDILARIHPTPALCGTPTDKAFDLIRELEPFNRGLYGGGLGWSAKESSDWVVAIRSCLIQGKKAWLYAGTGIVDGSDPDAEWDELNQKSRLYDSIFYE